MHAIPTLRSRLLSTILLPGCLALLQIPAFASQTPAAESAPKPVKTGVTTPGVRRQMSDLHPQAIFRVTGHPDWFTATDDAVWVTSSGANLITELDAKTNQVGGKITVSKPCSGLAFAYGSLWIPSCGNHNLVRADPKSGKILAEIPAAPAESEGGVTAGAGSVWLVTGKEGILSRINPSTNQIETTIRIPSGSFNPLFADGYIWVSSNEHSELIQVDPSTNKVVTTIPTGRNPRFLTFGDGAVWTLNQGDGSISRIDTKSARNIANIQAGIPGEGGEITFGFHSVWATLFAFPITRIDTAANQVVQQWAGDGGDSIRAAHGSVWLTNLKTGIVWRLSPNQP